MQIDALGYVGIRTADIDQWATYGTRFLGMQLAEKGRGALALRMDDRKQRVIIQRDEGKVSLSTAGRWPTRPRCKHWRGIWRNPGSPSLAAHALSPMSAASAT